MKKFLCLAALLSVSTAYALVFSLSKTVFDNSGLTFNKHEGAGAFDSYLSMEINYAPVKDLFQAVVKTEGLELRNRGEAHITVVTPVEYFQVLKEKVSIKEINDVALESQIQKSAFNAVCVGKGVSKKDETFFVVVKSQDLIEIRTKIQNLFESRGGKPEAFKASHFFPHITLGFTSRDLHEADGVIKNEKSCFANLDIK